MDHFRFLQHYNRVKSGLLHNKSSLVFKPSLPFYQNIEVTKEKTLDSIPRASTLTNEDKELYNNSQPALPLIQSLPSNPILPKFESLINEKNLDDIEALPGGRRAKVVKSILARVNKSNISYGDVEAKKDYEEFESTINEYEEEHKDDIDGYKDSLYYILNDFDDDQKEEFQKKHI